MMPNCGQRTNNVLTMSSRNPRLRWRSRQVAEGDIARHAFEQYGERGREGGHDVDDWLNAERELRDASRCSAA
jgi:hypothetical protein